jgi:hypothetical protein
MLTKVLLLVAPTFPAFVSVALRAMLEGLVTISDVVEEMYLILLGEECSSNAMYGCISPSFIVKPTLLVKEIEEFRVGFAPP